MGTFVDKYKSPGRYVDTSLVYEQFDRTANYAAESFKMTQDYMKNLQDLLDELEVPSTDPIDVQPPDIPELDYGNRPDIGNLELSPNWPQVPFAPTLDDLPDISDVQIPVMTFRPPDYNMPETPDLDTVTPPGDLPQINMPEVPTAPNISLPDPPALNEIILPSPPDIRIPIFDSELPPVIIEVPGEFNWQETPYNSDIWCDLLDNVLHGLQYGGTGLDPEVEQEIWDRAKRRQSIEDDATMRKIRDTYSARGYDMPPGALAGAEIEAYRNADLNKQNLNSDIAVKQAELAQANTNFILDKGVQLEQILRGFHETQANRSFEAAKMIFQSGIEIMNARIAKSNLELEKYKADAAVYESRVRAALTAVEVYKAQVEAARVSSDIQKNLVDIYEKQIAAMDTYVRMYSAQMDAVKVAAQIEQIKMEIFNLETKAYIARMEGEKIKFDVYATQVDAEKAKAAMYAKTQLEAENMKLEAVLKQNTMDIEKYRGELAGYTAEIDAIKSQISAEVDLYRADISAYTAELGAQEIEYSAKMKYIEAKIQEARFNLEKAVAEVKAATEGYVAIKQLQEKGTEGVMGTSAQLCASAMNAVHASASISDSNSRGWSQSTSHGESISESHSFQEE